MLARNASTNGSGQLAGLLRVGDPKGEVTTAWHADR